NPVASVNVADGVPDGNNYNFTLSDILGTGKDYTVKVDANSFSKLNGTTSAAIDWHFTTQSAISTTTFTPANGAGSIAPNTTLKVTFGSSTTRVIGKSLNVYTADEPLIPLYTIQFTDEGTASAQQTFT